LRLEVMGRKDHLEEAAEALERLETALAELGPVLLNLSGGMKQ